MIGLKNRMSFIVCILAIGMVAALLVAGTALGEVSRTGLVAEYHFEGDAKDSSGNGNDGTVYGASFVEGKVGKALSFDGSNDYVEVLNADILKSHNSLTVSSWIKVEASSQSSVFYFISTNGFGVWQRNNQMGLAISLSSTNSSGGQIKTNTWQQIVGTYDGTWIKFYINGELKGITNWPGTMELGRSRNMIIGTFNGQYWTGIIDEVRIYNRVLSAEEIKTNYEGSQAIQAPVVTPLYVQPIVSHQEAPTNWIFLEGILAMIAIGIVALSMRHRDRAPRPPPAQPIRAGTDILDAGYILSKKASSLFNKKDYDSALETYSEALEKFFIAWKDARDDASLAKSIENNIISSRRNILACKSAIGIGVSETAKIAFDGERCGDAERLYKEAMEHYEGALKDAKELDDTGEIEKMQALISETKSNITSCYVTADKIKVEGLYEQAGNLIKEAVKFREKLELSKARNNLKKAESIIEEAYEIATKRGFDEAQQIFNRFRKNMREERNTVDDLQLKPIERVKVDKRDPSKVMSSKPDINEEFQNFSKKEAPTDSISGAVDVKTAFDHKGATIIYKLKIENNTSEPISDIKVYPVVPEVFLLKEKEKLISLIEPKSSQTVTFEIRPTGECGDCNVSGRVNYYNFTSRNRRDIELEPKSLSIVCPILHRKEIGEAEWHDTVSNLMKTEEGTREINISAESLFAITSRIIKDMHLYMQNPEITQNQQLFNGVARFYGEGVKGLKYAAQIEVIGGAKKSKLILKAWAEKEDTLTGFYHKLLDSINKRTDIKEYINESINNYYHFGHNVGPGGKVIDAADWNIDIDKLKAGISEIGHNIESGGKVIDVGDKTINPDKGTAIKNSQQTPNIIGPIIRKCQNCEKEAQAHEKFCIGCGTRL